MAWNEPGGPKDKDPWGGGNKNQGPPDLDEVIRNIQNKLSGLFGGKKGGGSGGENEPTPIRPSSGGFVGAGILLLLVVGAWIIYDMTYIIQPAERGVVLRFGAYTATMEPGLNFRLPRPIETVERVDVDQSRNVEIGYRSGSGRTTKSTTVSNEALMLTRDENIIDLQFAVQYRVKSASDYIFNTKDPDLTLRSATESAVRETVGQSDMDFVITDGRAEIVAKVKALTQEIIDRYETGLIVTSVNMQDAQPPEEVQHAFDDAVKAREDEQRLINEAEAYSNDVIPRARGAAARAIEEANAYKAKVVAEATGEASRFVQILAEYEKAPVVTRQRLYLETMETVLANTSKVMVDVDSGNNLLYLPLDRMGAGSAGLPAPIAGAAAQFSQSGLSPSERFGESGSRSTRSRERR